MAGGAVFDPATARWLVQLGKKLEGSQLLNPGQMERVVLKVMPRFQGGGGASIQHAFAPTGGIPAATWDSATETMTPGQASCRVAENVSGAYSPTADTVLVENPVGVVIGSSGRPMTIGKNTSGKWTVLVEDCTSSEGDAVDGGSEDPTANSSSNFGMGLGV